MAVTKKPDLSDPVLRAKLAKGMGHNYYGEPAWPNDLLYIFPVVILGTFAGIIGLSVLDPAAMGEPANPFATPLEILPEWYFFPVFQLLRTVPNKLFRSCFNGGCTCWSINCTVHRGYQQIPEPFPSSSGINSIHRWYCGSNLPWNWCNTTN